MKTLFCVVTLLAVSTLTGCQSIKSTLTNRDNGSLDYIHAQKLPPLNMPAHLQTTPFTPLYAVPDVAPTANAVLTDPTQKQYRLPKPPTNQ